MSYIAFQNASHSQTYLGPGDKNLPMSEIDGYQPVSRIGEIVINAFVDPFEFSRLQPIKKFEYMGEKKDGTNDAPAEYKPYFHEWASVTPGMVCLTRKNKTQSFRQHVAAETAVPVVACAACLPKDETRDWFFAGVARTKSTRSPDDGLGPATDEFFTLTIRGMVTMLNTSGGYIYPGDTVEWTLVPEKTKEPGKLNSRSGPRRIGIQRASASSTTAIGRALGFAKPSETLDVLIDK